MKRSLSGGAAARLWRAAVLGAAVLFSASVGRGAEKADTVQQQLQELRQANTALQEQLRAQKGLIETLSRQVGELQSARSAREQELADLKAGNNAPADTKAPGGINLGKLHITGEGGVGFFHTAREGSSPNSEFRVDEAKLFFEAPVWENVYFFSELNLAQREESGLSLKLGEFYVDFEDVSRLWNRERQLNVRAGRMDIPFGEEYLTRDAIDNPLISHSLADFWGVDEGVELYGKLGKFSYALAVQNGSDADNRDFNRDKSVAGRISYDPTRWLHFSVSAMRTGDLNVQNDQLSALWFGNGYFRSLGSTNTTAFRANLVQGDVAVRWARGHLSAAGGVIRYDDNDPAGNNRRTVYYYSFEGQQFLTRKLYAAARFSHILADKGFPLVGQGDYGDYFYESLTESLWRLSLGVGYRFSENLLLKAEYSFERGKETGGDIRNQEDMFSVQAALKF
ncbi:MAG: outer membrane beta-barrel protein [Verrucomicrobia bacterium]|nr:outer membrane beta-barrel protein [Verrucomicrobiota bacterium]